MQYGKKDFELAERFCAVALGADLYYRKEQEKEAGEASFSAEGLVPVNFSGVKPAKITSWQQAIRELEEIYHGYEKLSCPQEEITCCSRSGLSAKCACGFPGSR